MHYYKHTQTGYVIISTVMLVLILTAYLMQRYPISTGEVAFPIIIIGIILFLLISFSTLTVSVDTKEVNIRFGYGIYSKKFPMEKIKSFEKVRNKWYFGWGVRFWPWPKMYIYNVSGLDAIELVMSDGKKFRIGTDEPNELLEAIRNQK